MVAPSPTAVLQVVAATQASAPWTGGSEACGLVSRGWSTSLTGVSSAGRCPCCLTGPSAGSAWLADSSSCWEAWSDWERVPSLISWPPSQDPAQLLTLPGTVVSTQLQPHSCLTLVGNGPLHSESCPHCPGFRSVPGNTSAGLSPGLKQHQLRTGSSCLVCSQTPRGTGTRAALAHSSASWNSCSRSVSAKFFSHSCSHRCL